MGEISTTSEVTTPLRLHLDELRAKDKERREDLQIIGAALDEVRGELRRVGSHVMALWWGFLLMFILVAVDYLSKGGPHP